MKIFLVTLFLAVCFVFLTGALCAKQSEQPVETSQITIKNMAFEPQNISINQDTVVTWTNKDNVVHQIESDGNLSDLLSGEIQPNGTFIFTFDKSGTFKYHCKMHPEMKGEVIVK